MLKTVIRQGAADQVHQRQLPPLPTQPRSDTKRPFTIFEVEGAIIRQMILCRQCCENILRGLAQWEGTRFLSTRTLAKVQGRGKTLGPANEKGQGACCGPVAGIQKGFLGDKENPKRRLELKKRFGTTETSRDRIRIPKIFRR
ncbi:hypothetical protein TNCV_1294621 [Trichonephila clavipes]|nr:hypothetical protein TNCV_1294621 [Trichonephila clavipes]